MSVTEAPGDFYLASCWITWHLLTDDSYCELNFEFSVTLLCVKATAKCNVGQTFNWIRYKRHGIYKWLLMVGPVFSYRVRCASRNKNQTKENKPVASIP